METRRQSNRLAGEEPSPFNANMPAAGDGSPANSIDGSDEVASSHEGAESPFSVNMNVNSTVTSPQDLRPNAISVTGDLALMTKLAKLGSLLERMPVPVTIEELCQLANVENITKNTYPILLETVMEWNLDHPVAKGPPIGIKTEPPIVVKTEPTSPTFSNFGKATDFLSNRPEAQAEMTKRLAERDRLDRTGGNNTDRLDRTERINAGRPSNQFDNSNQYQDHSTSKSQAPYTVISSNDPPILKHLDWPNAEAWFNACRRRGDQLWSQFNVPPVTFLESYPYASLINVRSIKKNMDPWEYEKYLLSSNFSELVMEITFAMLGSEKPGEFIIRTFDPGKLAMRQINAYKHSAIGTSPYEVIFGTRLTMDMKMYQETPVFTDYSKLKDPGAFLNE
jgi:hypothetical protein